MSAAAVVEERGHRPWPLPDEPWLMAQTWVDLTFLHWPVDPAVLRPAVPESLPLDTYDGSAWIGVTPFAVRGLRLHRLPPVPGLSRFAEVNVRTYVTVDGKPGIYFLSLDATSRAAVFAAQRKFRLPYFRAAMTIDRGGEQISYRVRRDAATQLAADVRATSPPQPAVPGTLPYFLAERYCLYALDAQLRPLRGDIHHPPWPLQDAAATVATSTMTAPYGIALAGEPVVHFSAVQDARIWPLRAA